MVVCQMTMLLTTESQLVGVNGSLLSPLQYALEASLPHAGLNATSPERLRITNSYRFSDDFMSQRAQPQQQNCKDLFE